MVDNSLAQNQHVTSSYTQTQNVHDQQIMTSNGKKHRRIKANPVKMNFDNVSKRAKISVFLTSCSLHSRSSTQQSINNGTHSKVLVQVPFLNSSAQLCRSLRSLKHKVEVYLDILISGHDVSLKQDLGRTKLFITFEISGPMSSTL